MPAFNMFMYRVYPCITALTFYMHCKTDFKLFRWNVIRWRYNILNYFPLSYLSVVQSILALTKNFNEIHVLENGFLLKSKALWYSGSKVWFLIQIILVLGFNCCYSWGGKKIPSSDALIQTEKQPRWLSWLHLHSYFSFPSSNYAKFFVEIQQANFHLPWCQSGVRAN